MTKIDLQIHTAYSDGKNTPSEIVSMTAALEMGVIAITDHDTLGGVSEALSAADAAGVTVIPAVEVTTSFHGKPCHLLGYGVDHTSEALRAFLDPIFHFRRENLLRKFELLNAGFRLEGKPTIDLADYVKSQGKFFNTPNAATYLADRGFTPTRDAAFELLRTAVVEPLDVKPKDAIDAIHAAGGLAVVSHPFAPKLSLKNIAPDAAGQDALIKELVGFGLDGIECYQSGHLDADTERALSLAKRFGLLVSGGSDWHGTVQQLGEGIRDYIPRYPDRLGELEVTDEQVGPLLDRLNIRR